MSIHKKLKETIVKFYLKILLGLILMMGLSYLTNLLLPPVENGVLEVYFSVFGSVYAIVVGFVLLVVITNYNNIKKYISSEINALQDLRDYLLYIDFDSKSKEIVRDNIKDYACSVITKEWSNLLLGKLIDSDTSHELYEIIKSVNQIQIDGKDLSDKIAVKKLINTIGDITTYRTNRLSAVNEKLPSVMIQLISFLSICIILPFSLIGIEGCLWWFANSINAFTIIYIYMIINDLNDPFHGNWNIKPIPFEEFLKRM